MEYYKKMTPFIVQRIVSRFVSSTAPSEKSYCSHFGRLRLTFTTWHGSMPGGWARARAENLEHQPKWLLLKVKVHISCILATVVVGHCDLISLFSGFFIIYQHSICT